MGVKTKAAHNSQNVTYLQFDQNGTEPVSLSHYSLERQNGISMEMLLKVSLFSSEMVSIYEINFNPSK